MGVCPLFCLFFHYYYTLISTQHSEQKKRLIHIKTGSVDEFIRAAMHRHECYVFLVSLEYSESFAVVVVVVVVQEKKYPLKCSGVCCVYGLAYSCAEAHKTLYSVEVKCTRLKCRPMETVCRCTVLLAPHPKFNDCST